MPTVLLARHGRTDANAAGVLAGRKPGVQLDETGRAQSQAVAARLANARLAAVVSSPLDRCAGMAAEVVAAGNHPEVELDDRLVECDYGDWTGGALRELARRKLWKVVQSHPAAATFPGGESLRGMQARAVAAIRDHDEKVVAAAGPKATWLVVSHGDVIKAVVADALGLHLDLFQRLVVDPGSLTMISYTDLRPFVVRLNDTGREPIGQRSRRARRRSDAAVGGGDGAS